jgi:hypothetical protein
VKVLLSRPSTFGVWKQNVDVRHKAGHDDGDSCANQPALC